MKTFWVLTLFVLSAIAFLAFSAKVPLTKAELGRLLFFDAILSRDYSLSCASCHKPAFAFADSSVTSRGVGGAAGSRNTPSVMNMRLQKKFFWDGRAGSLEAQALEPISNPAEMNLPLPQALARLQANENYRAYFNEVFGQGPTKENLAQALAAFERTLETSNSAFDEWKFANRPEAVSKAVQRGFALFNGKARCVGCHFGADFHSNDFRNIGLFNGKQLNDSGRIRVTGRPQDLGSFKIGSLRNIALTAPYMHNGMFQTLAQVIDFYNHPKQVVPDAINTDTLLQKPLGLSKREQKDLEAFLISLTDKQFLGQQKNKTPKSLP